MAVVITWTKEFSSTDDGAILSGSDLENIQTAIEAHSHTSGLDTFLSLSDTPSTYSGSAGYVVKVNSAATALEFGSGATATYTVSFTNSDLVAGILTVTHSLGTRVVHVQVYNDSYYMILPDEVILDSSTSLRVDLSSYGTITGTWNVKVVA